MGQENSRTEVSKRDLAVGLIIGFLASSPLSLGNYLQSHSIHYPLCVEYPGYNSILCFLAKLIDQIDIHVLTPAIILLATFSLVHFGGFSWKIGIWAGLTTIMPVFFDKSPDFWIPACIITMITLVLPSVLCGLIGGLGGLIATKFRKQKI